MCSACILCQCSRWRGLFNGSDSPGTEQTGPDCSALPCPLCHCACVLLGLSRRCPHTSLQHASCSSQLLSLLPPLLLPLRMFVLFSLVFCGLSPVCCGCWFFSVYWCVCFCVCVSLPLCVCVSVFVCVCVSVCCCVSLYALPARCFRTARRHVVPRVKVFFDNDRRQWETCGGAWWVSPASRSPAATLSLSPTLALFLAVSLFFASKLN